MKIKSKIQQSCALAAVSLGLLAVNTLNAATVQTGYIVGQVFPSFVDKAAAGDNDNTGNLGFTVQMTNLWQPGQTIRITGVAWPTRTAPVGTFTFYFYDLDQGANPNAFDGNGTETLIGTNTATLGTAIGAGTAAYCIFDQPIVFTAHSRGIAVTWTDSGGNQIIKVTPNTAYTNIVRVNTTTGVPIGGTSPYLRFSLFGSVVQPAPTGSLTWQGNVSSNWDGTATNWSLALGANLFAPTNYTDNGAYGPNVIFDDTVVSPTYYTNINLTTGTPLRPSSVVLNNSLFRYNFSGPSIITGATILTNGGSGVVTLNTANNFTGGSVLSGGRIRLANVGGLGAGTITFRSGALSSVGATPLTITNNLSLIGTAVLGNATDNGVLTINSLMDFSGGTYGIDAENNVILTGVLTNGGIGAKSGPGTLTLTGGLVDNESIGTWGVLNGSFIVDGISVTRPVGSIQVGASAGNGVATFIITNGASVTINSANVVAVGAIGQSALTSSNYLYLSGSLGYASNFSSGVLQMGQSSAYDELDMLPGSMLTIGGVTYNIGQALANISVLNINGGTIAALQNNANFIPVATATFTTAVNVFAGGVTFDSGNYSITIPQPLLDGGGGGGLTKVGSGTLWLSGANTYTGPTVVKAGTLGLYPGSTLSATSSLTVSNGAAVATDLTLGGETEVSSLSLNGSGVNVNYGELYSSVNGNLAINNSASSGVVLNVTGVNTITVTGVDFGVGQYPIIQFASRTGNGSFVASLPYGVVGSVITNGNQIVVNITQAPKSVTWFGSTDSSTINNNWNLTSSNWNSGNASYTDDGLAGDYVTFDDSVFNNGSGYATNVNLTLPVRPASLTANNSLNYVLSTTSAGKITGQTTFTKNNTGNFAIKTANDFTGGSTLNSGAVFVGNNLALGTGAVTLNGGELASDGGTARTLTNSIIISTNSALGDLVNTGTLTLAGPVNFNGGARNLIINSPVVFSGTVTNGDLYQISGPGTLTYSGVTGTTSVGAWQVEGGDFVISGGYLNRSAAIRIGNTTPGGTSHLIITNGCVVNISGASNNLRVGNDQAPAADPASTNILNVAGTLAWVTNSGGYVYVGYAGQFSQINLLPGGLLQVAAISSGNNISELNLNGGTLAPTTNQPTYLQGLTNAFVLSGGVTFNTMGYNIGVAQPLLDGGGNGGLTKTGNGTLALNGANTYTGLTTVSGGSLGGTGVISGPVTIAVGGTVSPGNSIGTLTINNNFTNTGTAFMELDASSLTADQVTIAGNTKYGGSLVVSNLSVTSLAAGQVYQLFTASGTKTGNFASITVLGTGASGLTGTFNPANGQLTLANAVVSQPVINQVRVSAGNLILQGTNGTPSATYSIITATNLTTPLINWTTNTTGVFGAGGAFSNGIPMGSNPAQFFRIKTP